MLRTGCEMTPFLAQLHRACIGLASTSDRGPIGLTSEVETAGDIAAKLGDRCTPVVAHHTHHIRKTAELHNSIYMCDSLPIARALSSIEGSFGISQAPFLWQPFSAPIILTQFLQVDLTTYTVSRLLNLLFLAPFPLFFFFSLFTCPSRSLACSDSSHLPLLSHYSSKPALLTQSTSRFLIPTFLDISHSYMSSIRQTALHVRMASHEYYFFRCHSHTQCGRLPALTSLPPINRYKRYQRILGSLPAAANLQLGQWLEDTQGINAKLVRLEMLI